MEFFTRVTIDPQPGLVDHERPVILLGSCFSDSVGQRLVARGFNALVNPCGTLYNPASIASTLMDVLYRRPYTADDLFERDGLWHSYSHHSRFSRPTADEALDSINAATMSTADALAEASVLIVTFGTSWIFRLAGEHRVVANCHRMPPSTFSREFLGATAIHGLWKKIVRELLARNPQLRIVFTVSPIRHMADTAHGNQLSKANLLLAVDRLCQDFPDNAIYFPSYEIVLDELRDYRFYAADMVHPSDVAVDYIYTRFAETFMTEATCRRAAECLRAYRSTLHRPLH